MSTQLTYNQRITPPPRDLEALRNELPPQQAVLDLCQASPAAFFLHEIHPAGKSLQHGRDAIL